MSMETQSSRAEQAASHSSRYMHSAALWLVRGPNSTVHPSHRGSNASASHLSTHRCPRTLGCSVYPTSRLSFEQYAPSVVL